MNDPHQKPDELAHEDDTVIGKAVRWSVIALVLVAAAVITVVVVVNRKPPPPPANVTKMTAPTALAAALAEMPTVNFTDITKEAGIDFVQVNGAHSDKLLPETMGGGVAFFDYDNDGDHDLLFINSTLWPGSIPEGRKAPSMALYQNDGAGHFKDVTAGSGLDISFYGMGAAIGDYDNDGL